MLVEEIEDHLPPHTLVLDVKNVIYVDEPAPRRWKPGAHLPLQGVRLIVSGLMFSRSTSRGAPAC